MNGEEKFQRINIRRYFQHGSEGLEELHDFISDFSCPRTPDVERFLKNSAVEFTKKDQSVTYLVFSSEAEELLGYFSITVKPLTIAADRISRTVAKRLERVSRLDEATRRQRISSHSARRRGGLCGGGGTRKTFRLL